MHIPRVLSAITGLMIAGVLAGAILGSLAALVALGGFDGYQPYGAGLFVMAGMVCGLLVGLVVAVVWLVRGANSQDRRRRQDWDSISPLRNRTKER